MIYPPDIEEAESWGANCGPTALAAILEITMTDVRPLLAVAEFESRHYMNLTHVKNVLKETGRGFQSTSSKPRHGLIFIQWGGHDHKPVRAQYTFTHWIAVEGDRVFDVNFPSLILWDFWSSTMPAIMKDEGQGDGTFRIRSALQVAVARK